MTSLRVETEARETDRQPPSRPGSRDHATRRLAEEMGRAQREGDYQFSILVVEFEGLTDSADRLGYALGGDVWRRALSFLTEDLRAQDLCCRLSGDEFLLILSGGEQSDAERVVDSLRRRWTPAPGSREADLHLSIGLASYPANGCKVEQLLCAADEALHADRMRNELIQSAEERRSALLNTAH